MELNGIDLGRAWCAAGARNFHGQGWAHHRRLGPLAPDFSGSTLVAKTTTLGPRPGNMPLTEGLMPGERFPRCVRVNLRRAAVLNAVGLSGPGLEALLAAGAWQRLASPFILSFMAVADGVDGRLREAGGFADRLRRERDKGAFLSPFAVQVNASCPNVGKDPGRLASEATALLEAVATRLPGVPLIPKFNLLASQQSVAEIASSPACAAVAISNTIPWGQLPNRIDWRGLFGPASPLAHLGGGGLSGAPLTPLVREWMCYARAAGIRKPIVAGGGVMRKGDATHLLDLGASAVEVGSVAIVRPWRVRGIIRAINDYQHQPKEARIGDVHRSGHHPATR